MPRRPARAAQRLSEQPPGRAADPAGERAIEFAYAEDGLALEPAIPVSLSLPLRPGGYHGGRVLAVFENLLADSVRSVPASPNG